MTNEARISPASTWYFFLCAECVKVEDSFFIFERIDVHVAAFPKLHTEDGNALIRLTGMDLPLTPSTS